VIIGIVLSKTPSYSETFFISKIKGLQDSGCKVVLFVQSKSADFNLCPVYVAPYSGKKVLLLAFNFLNVSFKWMFHLKTVYRFIKLGLGANQSILQTLKNAYHNSHILSKKLDWLHFGFATMAIHSELVAKAIKAKMAVSLRGFDIAIYPVKHPNCYDLLWKHVDKIHVISNDLMVLAHTHGLSKSVPIVKITPAIDVSKFKDLGVHTKEEVLQLITVARLHWKKGLLQTLEALALIKNTLPKFNYTIIGTGEAYDEITFAIYQLHLTDCVTLVGKKEQREVIRMLSKSHLYLQYSLSEGFCNALLEAQAMGLLCIASNAEGLSENVLDRETGWIVEKNSPKLLAKTLLEVVNLSATEKEAFSNAAKKRVNKQFNLELQQQAFLKFYH
jgi:colanic acid/amylovoran biosynthesis glycosyltransferase